MLNPKRLAIRVHGRDLDDRGRVIAIIQRDVDTKVVWYASLLMRDFVGLVVPPRDDVPVRH